jgi:hypothetical protein
MKNFIKKNWILILVIIYVISPDLVPGPLDDTALLIAEFLRRLLVKKISERRQNSLMNKK